MNKIDNNVLLNLEEANDILRFVKRIYTGRFDGVFIEEGDEFAYYPQELKITIARQFDEDEEEAVLNILRHVNKEFNADFDLDLRTVSVQALLHEMGHHIDFDGKILTNRIDEYLEDNWYCRTIFNELSTEFSNKVDAFNDRLRDLNPFDIDNDEELRFELAEKELELREFNDYLDTAYRMIPSEYAADEFSARIFMTYIKPYKKNNYQVF